MYFLSLFNRSRKRGTPPAGRHGRHAAAQVERLEDRWLPSLTVPSRRVSEPVYRCS